jgi:hypothetical protein
MITSIQQFIENNDKCIVTESVDGFCIRAKTHDERDLQEFQNIAISIIDQAGEHYVVQPIPHTLSDYSVDYIGTVCVKWLE